MFNSIFGDGLDKPMMTRERKTYRGHMSGLDVDQGEDESGGGEGEET